VRTLSERLEVARRQSFIGRQAERALFAAALAGEDDAFPVLYMHGPGGVGKSALLHIMAGDARAAGREVVELDGRLIEASPRGFENAAGTSARDGMVFLIDAFEHCQGLETWLRDRFLPRLPSDTVVVIAGRIPPDPDWSTASAWTGTLRVIALRNLSPDESATLMRARGVPDHLQPMLQAFTAGHPLGLTLAAEVAANDRSVITSWEPGRDLVGTLLNRLVGELPFDSQRRALALCAHVEVTTEDILRRIMPADEAARMFEWLCGLSFMEAGSRGVYPHDVARNVLEADLRWRDPEAYADIHHAVRSYLLDRVRASLPADTQRNVREFLFIVRHSPAVAQFFSWWRSEDLFGDGYQPADRPSLLALAEKTEGPEFARIVEYWLDTMPTAFFICRRISTGEPVGFSAWLELTDADPEHRRADPVVDTAWAHVAAEAELRPGEHIGISRCFIDPEHYEQPSPVMDLMLFHNTEKWLTGKGLAWFFSVAANGERWREQFARVDQYPVSATARVGSTDFSLFARDWRRRPLEVWLDQLTAQALSGHIETADPEAVEHPVLSRTEFDGAVRAALRALRSESLSASVLTRSKILAGVPMADRTRALRQLLRNTIDSMSNDPRTAKQYRVLDATFLHGAPTQEVAASSLGLPFTTYRRHLTQGIKMLADRLWEHELGAAILPDGKAQLR
jgi:hypothetical protein